MSGAPWYDVAFDAVYADLYHRRDQAEAERVIAWLAGQLPAAGPHALARGVWVDLACGGGRHLRALARRGVRTVGIDRSRPLLDRARADAPAGVGLVRGDLRRLPFRDRVFAGGLSMFTSLGYFDDEGDNRMVLAEAARVIQPGGRWLVDYLNADWLATDLVPQSSREAGPYRIDEVRRIDPTPRRLIKEIAVFDRASGKPLKRYSESVALWTPADLETLLKAQGFHVAIRAGDYDGGPFTARSPRLIVLAVRGEDSQLGETDS
jgi:ubiquinone/menaquinone biosynthesis C-methylase UbiE